MGLNSAFKGLKSKYRNILGQRGGGVDNLNKYERNKALEYSHKWWDVS
jgi:hypothetical protein